MAALQTAPDGFDIDPLTGMPKRKTVSSQPRSPLVSDPLSAGGARGGVDDSGGGLPAPPPVTTPGSSARPPPPPVAAAPPATTGPAPTISSLYKTPNDYLANFLAGGPNYSAQEIQSTLDTANKAFGLTTGSQAVYYAPGSHGPGSQEVIGLPGGYFAHANNDPNGAWQWVAGGDSGGAATAATPAAPVVPTAAGSVTGQQMDPALHDEIMKLLQQGNTPVDPNDPIIKSQVDAARVQDTRATADARAALAERSAAEGLPTSALDTAVAGSAEKMGEHLGGLQASLMASELSNRRAQVVDALQFASGEDARALNLQLAQIDAALKQTQLGQQNQQFYDTLGFNIGSEQDLMNRFMTALGLRG